MTMETRITQARQQRAIRLLRGDAGHRDLLQAIAFAGGGVFCDIPGGSTVAEMESQLLAAFTKIASKLPPPKLVYDEEN
jgi:hypothetical protein